MILWIIILLCFVYLLIVYIKQKSFKINAIIGCILSFILELVFVSYFLKMNFFVICILCVLGCWYILIMNHHIISFYQWCCQQSLKVVSLVGMIDYFCWSYHVPWHLRTILVAFALIVEFECYSINVMDINTILIADQYILNKKNYTKSKVNCWN